MAILQAPIESTPIQPPNPIKIQAPEYKGTVVDAKSVPMSSLLTFIEGGSWPVTYYSQVLGEDNATAGQDAGQHAVYQQYQRIYNLELRVTSSLSNNQTGTGANQMVVTGSAVIYPFLMPNRGDMFVALTADGKEGVFVITQSIRKTMFRESVYEVDYQLLYMSDSDHTRRNDLDKKTVKSVYFHKDLLQGGQSPMVIDADHKAIMELGKLHKTLVRSMYEYFYSTEFKTLILPGQGGKAYDPFVIGLILNTVNTYEHANVQYTRQYNTQDDNALRLPSVYTAIIERNTNILETCFRNVGLMTTMSFSWQPMMEGIRFSGLQSIVYPMDAQVNVDYWNNALNKSAGALPGLVSVPGRSGSLPEIVTEDTQQTLPVKIKNIDSHSYVFSQAFYERDMDSLSVLERLTLDHIDSRSVDAKTLLDVASNFINWGRLEQFYYIPVLICLIRGVIGTK